MAKKKVFISYDHSEDLDYKNLLKAWDANSDFEFTFDQRSPDVAINSDDAGRVKAVLTAKMKEAEYLFVIVGAKSSTSKWMNWEIDRAKESDIKLKLAAVKLSSNYSSPSGLLNCGCSFATSFTQERIIAALNSATNTGY
jgi:hypothetical protein